MKKRTLANLTNWPAHLVEGFRHLLKNDGKGFDGDFEIIRSLPHGHVAAVLGTLYKLKLPSLIDRSNTRPDN